ncbi:DUF2513 domain-containing protein [Aeromonas veronii]|uniref:DUF2513 domain-containing protein n=1 Tax=Aeromonas veronii TaxID=654 RepID=UPI001F2B4174|nr:DUF2513 domain-containing protein [Aeromonas veronii]MCF5889321.1 DUF2513 domain-containing protein [Aeromonas veronii]
MELRTEINRDILTRIAALPASSYLTLRDFELEAQGAISYHMEHLIKDGLVTGQMSHELGREPATFHAFGLTSAGQKRLDEIRNNTMWKRSKAGIPKGIGKFLCLLIGAAVTAAVGAVVTEATKLWFQ